jgi:ADP-ribosylglycohydrolase
LADPLLLRPSTPADRRACESLFGLSIGDALGARWEGSAFDPTRLTAERAADAAPERWTDDTQMALAVVAVLIADGRIDQDRLAKDFASRYEPWRGYGRGMHALLPALRDGGDWRWLSERLFPGGSYGNGSAMRVPPLGAYFHDAPAGQVVAEAERTAEVTHAHPEAKAGAVATALAAWVAARSRDRPPPDPAEWWHALIAPLDPSLRVTRGLRSAESLPLDAPLSEAVARLGNGSHVSCADTVPLALWIALRYLDDFESAVWHAVAAGGDTDTLAAIVGGIVAARVGAKGIPQKWRDSVEPLPIEELK